MYSPLNPSQIRNFTYRIDSVYNGSDGEVIVIHFKSKPGSFPRKTKIIGQGFIHCLKNEARPIKIVAENMEDHYTSRPYVKKSFPSVTHHRVEITYGVSRGKIYTSMISQHIDWVDSGVDTGYYYSYSQQRRRNPIGNKLREYRLQVFTDPVFLNKEQVSTIKNNSISQGRYSFILTAPFDKSKWESTMMYDIDTQRLFKDLNVNGKSLYEQAEKNAFSDIWIQAMIVSSLIKDERVLDAKKNRELNYYKQYESIYRNVYGKDPE